MSIAFNKKQRGRMKELGIKSTYLKKSVFFSGDNFLELNLYDISVLNFKRQQQTA